MAREARTPRASGRRRSSCSGFLKTLPNVRLFVGCAAFRCACSSATVALISLDRARHEPELDLGDDLARAEPRVPVRRARARPASSQRAPSASTTSARSSTPRAVAAVRARVHPHAAAGRARDRAGELEAAEAGVARAVQARPRSSRRRPPRAARRRPRPRELAREPQHERVDARRRRRAGSSRARPSRRRRRARAPTRAPPRARRGSRAARAHRAGPPVPSVVKRASGTPFLDLHEQLQPRAGSAPRGRRRPRRAVSTTSPGRARPARKPHAVLEPSASTRRGIPGRSSARASTTSFPSTPCDRLLARRVHVGHRDRVGRASARAELVREVPRPRVEVRLEEDEHAAAAAARAPRRARRRPSPGCARSRRRRARRRRRELEAAAGAANSRSAGSAARAVDAGELERGERGGRVAPVVLARQLRARTSTGSSSAPRTTFGTCGEPARRRAPATSASERERRVVVEVDVRARPRSRGRSDEIVRSDSSPSTTSQPSPAPRVPAELRHLAADQERRVEPEPVEARTRSSPSSSSCRARRRRRSSAGARRARRGSSARLVPGTRREGGRDDCLPPVRHDRLGRDRHVDPAARTFARYGVSTRSQPPTSAPHACASSA